MLEMLVVSLYHLCSPCNVCCHGGHHESAGKASWGVGACACERSTQCEIVREIPDQIICKEKCEKIKSVCSSGIAEWAVSKL